MSVDVDSSYVTEDSNVETIEEVACSPEEEFDTHLLSGNLSNLRFPLKLWRIVTDCSTGAIRWINNGTAIAINYQIFEREYLDASNRLFKTNNITSFVRQLNLYGFRKVPKNSKSGAPLPVSFTSANYSIFHHESFRSDRPDLLLHVNRRGIKPDGKKNRSSNRPRREPRRRMTVSSEQTTTNSSDSESSETESSISAEQVIEDGIVDLDQTELIIPYAGHQEIIEDVIPLPPNDAFAHKSKRKSQHQIRKMEAKRMRVRSESAAMKPSHDMSANINQQSVAEEFIRKIRSVSESKDDLSLASSSTNSAQEDEDFDEDEDDDDRDEMHLQNRQFVFDLKQFNVGNQNNRERVRVEKLTRHFDTSADLNMKNENVYGAMHEEEVMTEEVVEDFIEEENLQDGEAEIVEEFVGDDSGAVLDEVVQEAQNNSSDYFAEEHNTARALLSLTCAKLQRNVAGIKAVIEPASLTTAGLS